MRDALALIKELTEENERLRDTAYHLECEVHRERADTVRKMQERLNEAFKHYPQRCGECCKEKVDQIAKEMLEGEK
jgi:predicted nuclease with TOPRIM domain